MTKLGRSKLKFNPSFRQSCNHEWYLDGFQQFTHGLARLPLGSFMLRNDVFHLTYMLFSSAAERQWTIPKWTAKSLPPEFFICAFTSFTVNGVNLHFLSEVQPPQEQDNLKSMGRSIFGKALTLIPSSRGNLQSSLEHCNKSCPVESLSFALKTIICSVSVRLNINHVIAIKYVLVFVKLHSHPVIHFVGFPWPFTNFTLLKIAL